MCGSSLEDVSYQVLLDGLKVRAVFSDPPYNLLIQGHVSGLGKVRHREFGMASGEMSVAEFIAFLLLISSFAHSLDCRFTALCLYGRLAWARGSHRSLGRRAYPEDHLHLGQTNAGMGSLYRQQTEFVHVFKNGDDSVAHINNVQFGKHGRYRTYPGANTFRRGRRDDLKSHPTVKPWALVADAIKDCTNPGDGVLDAFCGSGTTIIAGSDASRRQSHPLGVVRNA